MFVEPAVKTKKDIFYSGRWCEESLGMVEADSLISWVPGITEIEYTDAFVEHLEDGVFLTLEELCFGNPMES